MKFHIAFRKFFSCFLYFLPYGWNSGSPRMTRFVSLRSKDSNVQNKFVLEFYCNFRKYYLPLVDHAFVKNALVEILFPIFHFNTQLSRKIFSLSSQACKKRNLFDYRLYNYLSDVLLKFSKPQNFRSNASQNYPVKMSDYFRRERTRFQLFSTQTHVPDECTAFAGLSRCGFGRKTKTSTGDFSPRG